MTAIATTDQARFDTALGAADIPTAFALLERYPDLRHTDLPSVHKTALKAIAANPLAIRQMVLGFASLSPSIRRFCKKYYPKLGKPAAADLLYLFVESLDPLRPIHQTQEGLLGNCGGYASPLGQAIQTANLSLIVKRPNIEVYSEASRFAREVLELLPSALAAIDFETFLLAFEYYYGLGTFNAIAFDTYESPFAKHSGELLREVSYILTNEFKEVLRSQAKKGNLQLFNAMETWLQSKILLEQATWQNTPIEPVRNRFLQCYHRDIATNSMLRAVAEHFACCPQEQRTTLYRTIKEQFCNLDDRQIRFALGNSLRYYQQRYPDEASQVEQTVAAASSSSALPTPQTGLVQSSSSFTVERDDALSYLMTIANILDLHGVAHDLFVKDLEFWATEEFPPPSSDPAVQQDEAKVQNIRQFIKQQGQCVSLVALQHAEYSNTLFELLQRAASVLIARTPTIQANPEEDELKQEQHQYHILGLMHAALAFLPDPLFHQWLEIWRHQLAPLHLWNYGFSRHDALPKLMTDRFPGEAPFLLLELQGDKQWPNSDDLWQLNLAQAYAQGGERGRQTVRQKLARVSLDCNSYYRRHDWHPPYLWLISQWWEKQDAELLATACDRCAIPMYWKGSKAYIPIVKHYQDRPGYAPCTYESSDGRIDVQDICKLVYEQQANLLPEIVQNNLKLAGDERAACTLLTCFANLTQNLAPFRDHLTELLELLESPHAYAITAGLELFTNRPELAADCLPDVLLATDRAIASTATGIAKQAVECVGQLAITFADIREQAIASLENALYSETKSILEETLKTWKKILTQVKDVSVLPTVHDRWQELASRDPKRYGKLVQALLAGR